MSGARRSAPGARALLFGLLALAPFASAQPQSLPRAADAGAISGVVSDGSTGEPVAGAVVQLLVSSLASSRGASRTVVLAAPRPRQMTDGHGRFVFQQLPDATYRVAVEAPGYLDGAYGRAAGGMADASIALRNGQWFADANAVLWRPASIEGLVLDERHEPLVGVSVQLLLGFRFGAHDEWAFHALTQTDDRGAYRFAGLSPGRYLVHVPSVQVTLPKGVRELYHPSKAPGSLAVARADDETGAVVGYFPVAPDLGQVYPPTFSPAARTLAGADAIVVDFGSHVQGVNVSLAPVPGVRVSGRVVGPAGALANLPIRLLAAGDESLGFGGETGLTNADADGRFTFAHVPAGNYVVLVGRALNAFETDSSAGAPQQHLGPLAIDTFLDSYYGESVAGQPQVGLETHRKVGRDLSGRATLSVGREAVDGLVVATSTGVTVSGRVVFDGSDTPSNGHVLSIFGPSIAIEPADGDPTRTFDISHKPRAVSEGPPRDPTFEIEDVAPGRYRLADTSDGSYHLIGATWNGLDLLATPLEITGAGPVTGIVVRLSSQSNGIAGLVRDAQGRATTGAVLIFPQDPQRWRDPGITAPQFRRVDAPLTGRYSATKLIPGEYLVAAVPVEFGGRLLDAEFLATLAPQATRITVSESGTQTVDLRVVEHPR